MVNKNPGFPERDAAQPAFEGPQAATRIANRPAILPLGQTVSDDGVLVNRRSPCMQTPAFSLPSGKEGLDYGYKSALQWHQD